jgi:hypothetical protein
MDGDRGKNIIVQAVLLMLLLIPILAEAQVAWVKDFDSALKKADKEDKFVIVDFSAGW